VDRGPWFTQKCTTLSVVEKDFCSRGLTPNYNSEHEVQKDRVKVGNLTLQYRCRLVQCVCVNRFRFVTRGIVIHG
jgi:hypothetical protein